jgi:hypothetical protein
MRSMEMYIHYENHTKHINITCEGKFYFLSVSGGGAYYNHSALNV